MLLMVDLCYQMTGPGEVVWRMMGLGEVMHKENEEGASKVEVEAQA